MRRSQNLPHDVALTLARDIASVATPVLSESSVLTDADLVSLIAAEDEAKQLAVAGRATLSEAVADALVAHGSEDVVVAVVSNPGAALAEPTLDLALDRFPNSERVHSPMIARDTLPVTIAERLVAMVSERLQGELVRRHALPADLATDLILDGRERATLALVDDNSPPERVEDLVRSLARGGRLTSSIIVRAACVGDLAFVETALAVMADVPVENAGRLVHDVGRRGLEALADKAGVGARDRIVLRIAVDTSRRDRTWRWPGRPPALLGNRDRAGADPLRRRRGRGPGRGRGLSDPQARELCRRPPGGGLGGAVKRLCGDFRTGLQITDEVR